MKKQIIIVFAMILNLSVIFAYSVFPRPMVNNSFFPDTSFIFNFTFTKNGISIFSNQSNLTTDSSGVAYTDLNISNLVSVPTRFLHYRDGNLIINKTFEDKIFKNIYAKNGLLNNLNITENITSKYFIGNGSYLTDINEGNASFNQTLTDSIYLNIDGSNANQDINIQPYDIQATTGTFDKLSTTQVISDLIPYQNGMQSLGSSTNKFLTAYLNNLYTYDSNYFYGNAYHYAEDYHYANTYFYSYTRHSDNIKDYYGSSLDSFIDYDGSNMVIKPDNIGSGGVVVENNLAVRNNDSHSFWNEYLIDAIKSWTGTEWSTASVGMLYVDTTSNKLNVPGMMNGVAGIIRYNSNYNTTSTYPVTLAGVSGSIGFNNVASGDVDSVAGVRGGISIDGSKYTGTITKASYLYGYDSSSNSPSITNQYGLYLEDVANGVNNYAIKTGLGKVELGDDTNINGKLNVSENISTGNIKLIGKEDGNVLSRQNMYNDTIGIIVYNDSSGIRMIMGDISDYV